MSDVELVIKIPNGAYNLLKTSGVDWLGAEHILNAVANGTVLPEHGRLIDADKLLKHFERGHMCWGEDVAFVINQETPTVLEGTNEGKNH